MDVGQRAKAIVDAHCDANGEIYKNALIATITTELARASSAPPHVSPLDMWIGNEHTSDVLRRIARRMDVDSGDALVLNTLAESLVPPSASGPSKEQP